MTYVMDLLQWLSTVGFWAAIVVLAVPAWRDVAAKWIAGRIQLGVDSRIETLRSELRKTEETFKGEIQSNQERVKSVADVALGALSGRQSALDARRLLAVERLWANKAKIDSAKLASSMMQEINFEAAAKASGKDPKVQGLFAVLDTSVLAGVNKQMAENQLSSLEGERPFLSPVVWALYSAYSVVLMGPVLEIKFLATGIGEPDFLTSKKTDELLKAALPEFATFIDEHSRAGYHLLIEALEEKLLAATQDMLAGREVDAASLQQAQNILKAASRMKPEPLEAEFPESLRAAAPPEPQ